MSETNFHLEIESNPRNLITVEEFVNYFAIECAVPENKIPGLLLSITEATTNAIIHGNKSDPKKIVTIDVVKTNSKLIIKIKDQGAGFNPEKVPDPTEPENLLKDSGRGLYLMRIYMDEITYNINSSGTETILVLNF